LTLTLFFELRTVVKIDELLLHAGIEKRQPYEADKSTPSYLNKRFAIVDSNLKFSVPTEYCRLPRVAYRKVQAVG
jgi:hypothetical protein